MRSPFCKPSSLFISLSLRKTTAWMQSIENVGNRFSRADGSVTALFIPLSLRKIDEVGANSFIPLSPGKIDGVGANSFIPLSLRERDGVRENVTKKESFFQYHCGTSQ